MTEKLKQKFNEEIKNLPKESQDAINSSRWEQITEEISKKYLLTDNELNDFQLETALMLLGLTEGDSYVLNIENNVGVGKNEAEEIAKIVAQKIFNPIYYQLSKQAEDKLINKKIGYEQTVDFILSGGDYSAFLERSYDSNDDVVNTEDNTINNNSKIEDIKNKFVI